MKIIPDLSVNMQLICFSSTCIKFTSYMTASSIYLEVFGIYMFIK